MFTEELFGSNFRDFPTIFYIYSMIILSFGLPVPATSLKSFSGLWAEKDFRERGVSLREVDKFYFEQWCYLFYPDFKRELVLLTKFLTKLALYL